MKIDKPKLKVTLIRSPIGKLPRHRACVKGLGLKRMWQTVTLEDNASIRGIINKVKYMVRISV
jgi:large subunit ribosomal protein L30